MAIDDVTLGEVRVLAALPNFLAFASLADYLHMDVDQVKGHIASLEQKFDTPFIEQNGEHFDVTLAGNTAVAFAININQLARDWRMQEGEYE